MSVRGYGSLFVLHSARPTKGHTGCPVQTEKHPAENGHESKEFYDRKGVVMQTPTRKRVSIFHLEHWADG